MDEMFREKKKKRTKTDGHPSSEESMKQIQRTNKLGYKP